MRKPIIEVQTTPANYAWRIKLYKNRIVRIESYTGHVNNGATRKGVANVFRGKQNIITNDHWFARASKTRLRLGCCLFTGEAFKTIRKWALAR